MSDTPTPKPTINDLKEEVLRRLDFAGFYQKYISNDTLRKDTSDGWTNRVLCPIHGDQTTPNFFVNVVTGRFKCHAAGCKAGGSAFDFWLIKNGFSPNDKAKFKDAVLALATEAGIDIRKWAKDYTPPVGAERKTKAPEDEGPPDVIPKKNTADIHDATHTPIPIEVVGDYQRALMRDHYKYLNEKRGLKKKTIDKALIGWDKDAYVRSSDGVQSKGRYVIPVLDRNELVRNLRKYSNFSDPKFKMLNHVTGKGTADERHYGSPARLYNLHRLIKENWTHVIFCEGEFDCLLLNQMLEDFGLTTWGAVTGTHGAGKFSPEWLQDFVGRHVYLCLDVDERSKIEAQDIATQYLLPCLKAGKILSAKIITLPLEGTKEMKDVSDYFLKADFRAEDFVKLCTDTPELFAGGVSLDEAVGEIIEVPDFVTALKDRRYIDKRIRVPITISGTTSKIYHAIREYKVYKCPLMDGRGDNPCCRAEADTAIIPYGHPVFIDSCMQRESQILNTISKMACSKDQDCKVKPVSKVVMEEYFAHQVVERWTAEENAEGNMQNSQELVQASVYILQPPQNTSIEPTNYMATGFIRTHPKSSVATLFVENMVQMEEDWKKFTVESQDNKILVESLKNDFTTDQIIDDITQGVTQIYDSDDILYTVLLSYLSPKWINFNGRLIRGWINSAILGDSGTGKSATYLRLSDWLELGDLFSVLSGTRTGLLYAVKQKNGEWHVQIGRYVQASGKIIAIDETDKADQEEMRKMAVAMQEGWLEVAQVASGGYRTETRAIFMLNPKRNNNAATISDFSYGCDALRECFDPMFIRRLDMAVFTMGRKKFEFYNQKAVAKKQIRLTPKMMRALVYWAWTRKPDQIVWNDESTDACLQQATRLSQIFGDADQIPLVNPNDFREKLARLTVAYAILNRSFSEDLQKVLILPQHVEGVATLLTALYSSTACNLLHRSKQAKLRNTLDDFESIQTSFQNTIDSTRYANNDYFRKTNHFAQMLILMQQIGSVRKRDLCEQLGVPAAWLQRRIGLLQSFNLLEMTRFGYKTTRKFNLFMQRWSEDPRIQEMLDKAFTGISEHALSDEEMEAIKHSYHVGQGVRNEYIPDESELDDARPASTRRPNNPFTED